ncbi:purine-cytosine permease family protein [Amycolatopsis sp.]|uniref:purine-cytosine permease family protein n=1 Tax=Amycolatopsis sp. TaxID=37632 RepID=UPI002C4B7291|nr:cytosine permease [Amycolatopsis sp.]HVV11828.1 cytosine permease [Amycolatopsis sp.]
MAVEPVAPAHPGEYGDRVVAVEPGGIEPVAAAGRHGKPHQLFWTWSSPNLEFATIFVGVLAVSAFGLGFWQALIAMLIGNGLGALSHAVLSARGPKYGVPQMVLSRLGFGFWGNLLPAALMSVTAGIGWFAVNSVSGAFALNTLTGLPAPACLAIVVALQIGIAFFGHNLVQAYERYIFAVLAVVFLVGTVVIFAKADAGAPSGGGGVGGFLLTVGAAFGYSAGWNPYAADYTRYLPSSVSGRAVGWFAGLGLFVSCSVLMAAGAASATIGGGGGGSPTAAFTGHMPGWLASVTLLAITLGAVAANALNVYSGALAFLCLGIRLPLAWRRAIVALGFGAIGFVLAWLGLSDAGSAYENFLLVISYWISPWLAVVFVDQFLHRGADAGRLPPEKSRRGWAGVVSFAFGAVASIALFANQSLYTAPVPKAVPAIGDITFFVGFVVAGGLYALLGREVRQRRP